METKARSVVKAVLWTLCGLVVMAGTGFAATGSLAMGGGLALANAGIGLLAYVIYERIWARIPWGRP